MAFRSDAPLMALALDRPDGALPDPAPLHRQIYDQVRDLVLAGRITPGARLPSSRTLAGELGCSRNTVLAAYDQLLSEGYLEGQRGSGTYVSRVLPEQLLTAASGGPAEREKPVEPAATDDRAMPRLSRRGRGLAALDRGQRGEVRAFQPGVPDLDAFPFDVWGRLLGRIWRRPDLALRRHGAAGGDRALREAIAHYLRAVRAVRCDWRQVLITAGAQQALDLVTRTLLDPGDRVWIEEPGYPGLRGPLLAAGAEIVPVPVDGSGLSVAAGRARAADARMAVVTPSHQYPLGVVMPVSRRLDLLDWARAAGAWIVEDDYDSEYRYGGRPLAALQGLDTAADGGRVVYIGTFSKVLFPSLRIGYLVVPPDLVEPMCRARGALDDHPSAVVQPALAAFIEDGHFAAHVRRMRALYGARQQALLDAARRRLDGVLEVQPDEAGLHLVAHLAPDLGARMSDREASALAARAGVVVPALSSYFLSAPRSIGLMLGYAAVREDEIEAGVDRLAAALARARR